MKLTAQLKEDTGYGWVMDKVETSSPFGHALVRQARWYGPEDKKALEVELGRVERCLALVSGRELPQPCCCEGQNVGSMDVVDSIIHLLYDFQDIRGSLNRPTTAPMDEVELFQVKHFLIQLERLAEQYAKIPPLEGLEIKPMDGCLKLLDPSGRRLPAFTVEVAFEPALERVREEKKKLEEALHAAEGEARETLMDRRREVVAKEDRLELEARKRLTMALLREKETFLASMDAIGALDLALAKARLAKRYHCCRPVLADGAQITAVDMVHPQVAAHLKERGGDFTAVSIQLDEGCTVITGANMGGKSVSMKSLTLNLLLTQTGFYPFAKAFTAPLFDSVSLICTDGQSVEQGLSSFGAEVAALGEVLRREKGKFFYVALDEFARGTNPREGAALAKSLVEYLGSLHCMALMTTHYDGVSDAARRHYRVAGLGALDTAAMEKGEAPLDRLSRLMDYHLVETEIGEPCPRDALRVCRLLDLDAELMKIFSENS